MANYVGRLTIGSLEVFPNRRLDPMPWAMRQFEPWGYFEQDRIIADLTTGTVIENNATWPLSQSYTGRANPVLNAIKPIVGIVNLTAYDYQSRYPGTFVPLGSRVYIDDVLVATIGNVGFASFQMHANDPHVIKVEMTDPFWGLPYVSYAETTQLVDLDGVISVSLNVPRALYEPWVYNITVESRSGSSSYAPVSADVFVDGTLFGTTDSNGHASVIAVDANEHAYIVVVHDSNVVEGETYRVSAECTFGNSSVVATMVDTPPRFDFKSQLQYIYDFAISPTTRLIDLIETGSFFNNEPITITPVYTGNIVHVDYTITCSAGTDTHTSTVAPFTWVWTPGSTGTPDTAVIAAVFLDDTGATGSYSESFVVHSKHVHNVHAVNASLNHPTPVPLVGAYVYVDGIQVGVTNSSGNYAALFTDSNTHIVRVQSDNPESSVPDVKHIDHSLVANFDQTSNFTYAFSWQVQNVPPVVTFIPHGMAARGRVYVLEALATDPDNAVAIVSFYVDNVFVGSKLTSPYTANWIPATTGSHAITVTATDASGASASDFGTINVSIAPVIATNAPSVIVVNTDVLVVATVVSINGAPSITVSFAGTPVVFTGPTQTLADTYEYQFTLNVGLEQHSDLVITATSTEGLATTYTKNIFVSSSYLPRVEITTRLAGPDYDTPVLVSADIYVDDVPVGSTDSISGHLTVNLPDNGPHKISGHYVPEDLFVGTIFSGSYGTDTVLQDFVFIPEAQPVLVVPVVKELPVPYTGALSIDPLFGAERDSYLRILYGSDTANGVTPGKFWDMRSLPLPYRPLDPTNFRVILESQGIGSLFRLKIMREHPTQVPTTDTFDFVAESVEQVISIYLGHGLNVFDVYAYDSVLGTFSRVQSTSCTATNYATVLYAYALSITKFIGTPLAQVEQDIYSDASTTIVSPLIGFDAELSASTNLSRSARQRLISGFINQPTSKVALENLVAAVFQQTPLISTTVISDHIDINQTWLKALPTAVQTHNSKEMHIWQLDKELARWALLPKYLLGSNNLADHSHSHTVAVDGSVAIWKSVVSEYNAELPEPATSWWELSISSEVDLEMYPHSRSLSRIVFPGLWDSGVFPYMDQGFELDTGRYWDSADVSGDIVLDGFIGTSLTGELPWNAVPEIGVGVLDRCVETTVISNSYISTFFSLE